MTDQDRVYQAVCDGHKSASAISQATGIPIGTVYTSLSTLRTMSRIESVRGGRQRLVSPCAALPAGGGVEVSATAIYWQYMRARAAGDEHLASSLWREYCRAVEAEQAGRGR